jgi:hypothetical protein
VHGDSLDCSSWEHDFENCNKFEEKNDLKAAKKIIENEEGRRKTRMKAHWGNNVWKKRSAPPEDWSKPLPDHLNKQYENSFLEVKSKELQGKILIALCCLFGIKLIASFQVSRSQLKLLPTPQCNQHLFVLSCRLTVACSFTSIYSAHFQFLMFRIKVHLKNVIAQLFAFDH